jgi:hypothetical protein
LTIACASAGPTPVSSAASVVASAVLIFTGPCERTERCEREGGPEQPAHTPLHCRHSFDQLRMREMLGVESLGRSRRILRLEAVRAGPAK